MARRRLQDEYTCIADGSSANESHMERFVHSTVWDSVFSVVYGLWMTDDCSYCKAALWLHLLHGAGLLRMTSLTAGNPTGLLLTPAGLISICKMQCEI